MKTISKTISKTSPLVFLLAGTAIAVASPALKQAARNTAVSATRGAMNVSAAGAAIGHDIRESWEDIVAEARSQKPHPDIPSIDTGTVLGAGAGGAVGAGLGGNIGGGIGAAVGGGIGSVVGAGLGSSISERNYPKDIGAKAEVKEKTGAKETKKADKKDTL